MPHATLADSEYSEMAIFSSTRWSAKLSGLRGAYRQLRRALTRSHKSCDVAGNTPVCHRTDKDTDRVRVGDGRQVIPQSHGLRVEGER